MILINGDAADKGESALDQKGRMATMHQIFQEMVERWSSSMVARTEAERFTGGLISEKYLANLDSAGKGPAGRIRCGRKVAYPVNEFVKWLEERSEIIPERHPAKCAEVPHE